MNLANPTLPPFDGQGTQFRVLSTYLLECGTIFGINIHLTQYYKATVKLCGLKKKLYNKVEKSSLTSRTKCKTGILKYVSHIFRALLYLIISQFYFNVESTNDICWENIIMSAKYKYNLLELIHFDMKYIFNII